MENKSSLMHEYPEGLKKMRNKIQNAIDDTIDFLEKKISEIDEKLLRFRR